CLATSVWLIWQVSFSFAPALEHPTCQGCAGAAGAEPDAGAEAEGAACFPGAACVFVGEVCAAADATPKAIANVAAATNRVARMATDPPCIRMPITLPAPVIRYPRTAAEPAP